MKKKIEELFRLAMKAQEKTSAYVSFETYENFVRIINAAGYDVKIEKRKCEKNSK